MTEAAKQLYISQPSLSQTIRQAEEQLGMPIFNRDTAPLSLTYAGQMYVKAAREVMSIDTNLLNEIEEIKKESHGRMRLGFSVQRGMQLLPLVIPEFTQKYPYVRIELHEHGSDVLEQLLIEGVCDLALITTSPKRRELHYELLENEEIVLMADQNTSIAQRLPDGTISPRPKTKPSLCCATGTACAPSRSICSSCAASRPRCCWKATRWSWPSVWRPTPGR